MELDRFRRHNKLHECGASQTSMFPYPINIIPKTQTNGLMEDFPKISWQKRKKSSELIQRCVSLVCGIKMKMDCLIGLQPHSAISQKGSSERKSSLWALSDRASGHPLCMLREVAYSMEKDLSFLCGCVLPLLHTSAYYWLQNTWLLALKWNQMYDAVCFILSFEITLKLVSEIISFIFLPYLASHIFLLKAHKQNIPSPCF